MLFAVGAGDCAGAGVGAGVRTATPSVAPAAVARDFTAVFRVSIFVSSEPRTVTEKSTVAARRLPPFGGAPHSAAQERTLTADLRSWSSFAITVSDSKMLAEVALGH